jgi:hypothetical protein
MRFALWIAVCLSACAPVSLGRVPPVSPTVAAEVIVIRGTAGADDDRMLTLDGQAIAKLPRGGYTRFAVQPGPHWLGVGCLGGWGLNWAQQHRTLLADPRTTYYFSLEPAPRCARIEPMTEAAAKELISQRTYRAVELPREQS